MELIKEMLMSSLLTLVVALVVTLVFGPVFIPWLRKLKFGQEIREEGPKWHQKKSGTPTMGGIMFIVAMAIAILVTTVIFAMNGNFNTTYARCIVLFVISLGFGVIGFVDDYIKSSKKLILMDLQSAEIHNASCACGNLYCSALLHRRA